MIVIVIVKKNSLSLSASSKVTIHSIVIKCFNGYQYGLEGCAVFARHTMTGLKTVMSSPTISFQPRMESPAMAKVSV